MGRLPAIASLLCDQIPSDRSKVAVLPHEGTFSIMYGSQTIPVGAAYRPGYISRPDEAGRFPVVVLVPGLEGLGSAEKALCRKLARNGLAVVAVEIFPANDPGEALGAYQETSDRQVLLTLQETVEYVQSDDIFWALSEKVGLLGFDVGGRPAIVAAARHPWVGSIAVVSTPLTGDEGREHQVADFLGSLPVAVLGLYGQDDPLIANETVDEPRLVTSTAPGSSTRVPLTPSGTTKPRTSTPVPLPISRLASSTSFGRPCQRPSSRISASGESPPPRQYSPLRREKGERVVFHRRSNERSLHPPPRRLETHPGIRYFGQCRTYHCST